MGFNRGLIVLVIFLMFSCSAEYNKSKYTINGRWFVTSSNVKNYYLELLVSADTIYMFSKDQSTENGLLSTFRIRNDTILLEYFSKSFGIIHSEKYIEIQQGDQVYHWRAFDDEMLNLNSYVLRKQFVLD